MSQLVFAMDHTIITESFDRSALGAELRFHFSSQKTYSTRRGGHPSELELKVASCFQLG